MYVTSIKYYALGLLLLLAVTIKAQVQYTVSPNIHIDQFGYRPNSSKVAVISNPQTGFDVSQTFTPSNQYELRKLSDGSSVMSGAPTAWQGGATDNSSGDKAWWFDFSNITQPGEYYVFDVGRNVGSYSFSINQNAYNNVLRAAMRMFYYNRCNTPKLAQHAGTNWADGASFIGAGQDTECRSVTDRTNAATAKDLSGGWWDAGDYNKYVTFANQPMHQLLDAYEQNKTIWTDNFNIPESGNGIPDIVDEIKWETDWLRKMQLPNGSVLLKMGHVNNSGQETLPPSTDIRPRYYYPGGCSSSTIAFAGILAHAAVVFKEFPALTTYADDLKTKAINAWLHYHANPKQADCDNGTIQAGDADWSMNEQSLNAVQAAVYLYALTNETKYRDSVDATYTRLTAIANYWWGPYEIAADALLYYTKLPNATASVVSIINSRKLTSASNNDFYKWRNAEKDPYRSYTQLSTYHWGSFNTRANVGSINYDIVHYNLDAANAADYRMRAEEMLHYYHGVNPLNIVYLSNMSSYGAKNSLTEIYHSWFKDGSAWDNVTSAKGGPAPGYVPGGPNKDYSDGNGACLLSPPCGQPAQKAYKNWNGIWPDASWKVTEPGIYYQSSYIKLLSKFITTTAGTVVTAVRNVDNSELGFKVSPNPIKSGNVITVEFEHKGANMVAFNIVDLNGRRTALHRKAAVHGKNSVTIPIKHLAAGVYCLQMLYANNIQTTQKFIIN
jgi:endoglucanase